MTLCSAALRHSNRALRKTLLLPMLCLWGTRPLQDVHEEEPVDTASFAARCRRNPGQTRRIKRSSSALVRPVSDCRTSQACAGELSAPFSPPPESGSPSAGPGNTRRETFEASWGRCTRKGLQSGAPWRRALRARRTLAPIASARPSQTDLLGCGTLSPCAVWGPTLEGAADEAEEEVIAEEASMAAFPSCALPLTPPLLNGSCAASGSPATPAEDVNTAAESCSE
mmetsp:Transcript_3145/g.9103  ORF Transcript_3145/g.9103 Transcript_3145/m.9103 type:complete len:226 (-) Transcript_3145:1001-1678(-)